MSAWIAFTKKEFTELIRTSRLAITAVVFLFFGIMNPAVAKLTPWLMEMMKDSMSESGFTLTETVVNDATSWSQFYKNMPTAIIVFVLLFFGIFTTEYQRGTLINMITKGLKRGTVLVSKSFVLFSVWTLGYWTAYGVTYGYNAYFWGNTNVKQPFAGALFLYVFGLWIISLMVLFSSFCKTGTGVLLGTAGIYFACTLLRMVKALASYLPNALADGYSYISGAAGASEYTGACIVTVLLIGVHMVLAKIFMDKINVVASC